MTIVKVQRPLMTNGDEVVWLVYDKARLHTEQLSERLVPRHVKDAMGEDHKAYFKAAWSSIVGWGISKRVSRKDW